MTGGDFVNKKFIKSTINLVNNFMPSEKIYMKEEDIVKTEFFLYDLGLVKELIKKGSFRNKGSLLEYPDFFPREVDETEDISLLKSSKYYKKLYVSSKYNAVMIVNKTFSFKITLLLDGGYKKSLKKIVKKVTQYNNSSDTIFADIKFPTEKNKYLEIGNEYDNSTGRDFSIKVKTVEKESLVFPEGSDVRTVFNDIHGFFRKETEKIYKKMDIVYKRGIIIHGDPGNGKSAVIREIIRLTDGVVKIIINPQIYNVTRVLSSIIEALKGKRAMIIIEDIDSLITSENRSAFLNILDGIDYISGLYFVGTTNYPERIDSAFMNRGGRFDKSFKVDNPSEIMRSAFFASRKLNSLFGDYHKDGDKSIEELFTEATEGFSMANLKELILTMQYAVVGNRDIKFKKILKELAKAINDNKKKHEEEHSGYLSSMSSYSGGGIRSRRPRPKSDLF